MNKLENLNGILWGTEDKHYFQPFPSITNQEEWGGSVFDWADMESAKKLLGALMIDVEVTYIRANVKGHNGWEETDLNVEYNNDNLFDDIKIDEVLKSAIEYSEGLTESNIKTVYYGTCEMCESKGTATWVSMRNGATLDKIEIKNEETN